MLELQFKPSDNLTLGLSGFLSDMEADNYNRNFMLWGGNFARTQAPQPGYVVQNGVLTNATYAGVAGTDYAVVVTDMRMPEIDGLGVLRHAQAATPDSSTFGIW